MLIWIICVYVYIIIYIYIYSYIYEWAFSSPPMRLWVCIVPRNSIDW